MVVNLFTGFTIKYFEIAYNAIAYIYIITFHVQHISSEVVKLEHHFRALCRSVLLNFSQTWFRIFLKLNFIFLILSPLFWYSLTLY